MSLEEIVKTALENPELIAAGGTAAYGAATYMVGRSMKYNLEEAEKELEEGFYNSPADILSGLYELGRKHACEAEIDYRIDGKARTVDSYDTEEPLDPTKGD